MILGSSHITWPSLNLDEDVQWLKEWGFREQFREQHLENHPAKSAFMASRSDWMAMVFMTLPGKTAVELVQYNQWPQVTSGSYEALWVTSGNGNNQKRLSLGQQQVQSLDGAFPIKIMSCRLGSAAIPALLTHDELRGAGVRSLFFKVNDLQREINFWKQITGFSQSACGQAEEGRWAHMNFRSPLSQWCMDIVLQETQATMPPAYIDGLGCTCLSMLTSDIRSIDHNLIATTGGKASDVFEVAVGGQLLEMCLARSPSGALLEFFQIRA